MNSIDQKVVEMKFDNSQFESAVSQTMSTLEKFKSKLNFKDTGKGLDKLGKATSEYQYTLQDVGQSVSNLEKRFSAVGTVGARIFEKLTDSAYGFVTKGIRNIVGSITQGGMSRAMNLEQARFQMQGILKDSEKVHRVIYEDILPELQGTPFSLDQAAVVIGQLTASGKTSSEQIKRATRGMAGLAAMTGHSFEDVGRIFTKVAGNGVMMAEELNQLSGYGVNAAADLANFYKGVEKGSYQSTKQTLKDMAAIKEAYGEFNEATIREAASKRLIHYGSMAAAMDSLYGAHAQKSIQMYSGALDDLKAALARIGAEPAALRLNFLRDAFNALVPAVDAVNAVIKPFWNASRTSDKAFKDVEEYVKPFTGPLAQKVQEAGWSFQKLFVKLDKNNEIVRVTRDNYKDLGLEMRTVGKGSIEFFKTLRSNKQVDEVTLKKTNEVIKVTKDNYKDLGLTMKKLSDGTVAFYKKVKTGERVYDEKQAIMNPKMLKLITSSTKAFVNTLSALSKVIKAVGQGIGKILPKVTLKDFADFAKKVEKFTKNLSLNYDELTRIRWFARGLFTPLNLAIRGTISLVGLLGTAFKTLWKYISPMVSVVNAFFGMIGRTLTGLGNLILNFSSILRGNIADATKEFRESERWGTILEKITSVCNNLAIKLDVAGIKAYKFLTHLHELPQVQAGLSTLGTTIDLLKKGFGFISDLVGKFFDKIKLGEKFTAFIDKIKDFFSANGEKAAGSLGKFGEWFGKFRFYASAVDVLTGSFGGLIGVLAGLPNFKPLKGVRKWFSDLGKLMLDLGRSFVDGDFFVDRLKDMGGWFANFKRIGAMASKGFVPAIKALGGSLPKLLSFKDYGEMLDAAGQKISSAAGFIFKTLGLFGTGVAQDATKGIENLSKMTSAIKDSAKDLKDSEFFKPIITLFDSLSKSFTEWAKNMDVQSAKRLVIALAYFGTCLYYLNTINNAAKAFRGLTKIAETVASGISALGRMANAISMIPAAFKGVLSAFKMVGYMTALAVALVGIAAAMFIISKIDPDRLVASAGIMAGIIIIVGGLIWGINKVANKLGPDTAKTMLTIAGIIGSLAIAVIAIAGSLYLLTSIEDPKALESAVNSIANIIVVFGIVMGLMSLLPAFGKGAEGASKAYGNVGAAAWALVGIAAGIRTMVEAIRELADMYQNGDEQAIKKAVDLVNMLIVMTGVFGLLAGWGGHGFSAGMAIIPMALGLKIIISTIIDLANTLKDTASLDRAMTALDALAGFVMKLGVLFVAIGVMNALSGLISKGDFISSGRNGGLFGAIVILGELIAAVWVVSQAMMQLGTLNDSQIENGIKVLEAFGTVAGGLGLLALLSSFAGNGMAAGVAAFAALAAGMFLLAEGIVALGETQHFTEGFIGMGAAVLGLIGSVVLATKLISEIMDAKDAAAIALLSAAMFGFALSIRMMAECPWESLMFAVIGLVGTMAIAAGVMSLFSAAGVAMLPIAGAFALLGIAALGLGAGIFLLTLALSALIPLIIGLGDMPMDKLQAGLAVLKEAAAGLSEVFGTLAGGILKLAGGLVTLGVALIVVGVGGVVLAAAIVACAAAVFLFAGSLIVLYEVLSNFFPSVVKPVENGMIQLIDTFTRGLLDPTVNTVSQTGDAVNQKIEEKGDEGAAIADEKAHTIADKMNFVERMKQNGFEGDMAELAAMTGQTPEEMAAAWGANSGQFTGAVDGTVVDAEGYLKQFGADGYAIGYGGIENLANGSIDASQLPIDANTGMLGKIIALHQKHEEHMKRAGEAQVQKMYAGMNSKEDLVEGEARTLEKKATPSSQYTASYNVGKGIADGLAAGIRAGADAVYRIAEEVGSTAAAKTKKGADVNSPSKKTIPVGEAIGEGLIVGMHNIESDVYSTSEDLASNSVDSLTTAMQKTAKAFSADLDFTPTITPVVDLTNIDQSVDQMGSMFDTAFGVNPTSAMNAAFAARSFTDSRNQNARMDSINRLASKIDSMTDTMNSRSLNNYINIDGSADPEAFADGLIRSFRLNARMT